MTAVANEMSTPKTQRIHELDALRGLAALGVVFWHYGVHFGATPLRLLFLPFYNGGFLLVDFFFVLSGFVIARAYWREPRQGHLMRNVVARLARLYPLHFVMLLATTALLLVIPANGASHVFRLPTNDAWHFLLNLTLLNQSGLQQGWSFNTPAWSISTEFLVNMAFLGFIALAKNTRIVVIALAGIGLVALLATQRPVMSASAVLGVFDLNLARCGLGFGTGVALWFLLYRRGASLVLYRHPWLCELGALSGLVALVLLMCASGRHPPVEYYLASILVAAVCVLFVPAALRVRRGLAQAPLVYLGDISYSTYLIHYPLQLVFVAAASRIGFGFASPLTLALFVGTVIAVSAITHRFVELPAQQRLLKLAGRKDVSPAAA